MFPLIVAQLGDLVRRRIARWGFKDAEAKDVFQEVFAALFQALVASGFPDYLPALAYTITDRTLGHHRRDASRSPITLGLPEAAAALGLPPGTVKSRLIAAKGAFAALARALLPPSQRPK